MPKHISIADFLTQEETEKAVHIFASDRQNFHARCRDEIIKPVMARIDKSLGQQNDADYLSYAVEYVLGQKM